jgi:hypothetical protein
VLVYVYPLRMVAELTLASISGGILTETPINITSVAELRTLYVVFGIGYASTAVIFLLLHRHALALADVLGLSTSERIRTQTLCARWSAVIVIALTSTLLGLFLPMGQGESMPLDSAPGFLYILVYVAFHVLARRERVRLAADVPAESAR